MGEKAPLNVTIVGTSIKGTTSLENESLRLMHNSVTLRSHLESVPVAFRRILNVEIKGELVALYFKMIEPRPTTLGQKAIVYPRKEEPAAIGRVRFEEGQGVGSI